MSAVHIRPGEQTPPPAPRGADNNTDPGGADFIYLAAGPVRADGSLPARHTMDNMQRGPANGIVLALVPGVLLWAGLVKLAIKLLG